MQLLKKLGVTAVALMMTAATVLPMASVDVSADEVDTELSAIENTTFDYAYDAQREPTYPSGANVNIELSRINKPLDSNDEPINDNKGSWTLTKVGTYASIKDDPEYSSGHLDRVVNGVYSAYKSSLTSKDGIVVHELKNGTTHIATGVIVAYDSVNKLVAFIGDNWSGDAGYILSKNQITSNSINMTSSMVATEAVQTVYDITVSTSENGSTAASASKAGKGDTITVTPTPVTGYEVSSVTYTDEAGTRVVSAVNGVYSFTMPESAVTISATYSAVAVNPPTDDSTTEEQAPAEKPAEPAKDKTPETGDDSNAALWMILVLLSGAVLAGNAVNRKMFN